MDKYLDEKLHSAYEMGKCARELSRCRQYLSEIKNGHITECLFNEANTFSMNTYKELYEANPIIAGLNTCWTVRNVTPIEELRLNLEALEKMLVEMVSKKGGGCC